MKKNISTAFLLFLATFSFAQQSISYTIKGFKNSKTYLSAVKGNLYNLVDSSFSTTGRIEFGNLSKLPTGVYRISFEDSLYTDIIINQEVVILQNNIDNLLDSLKVIESKENKVYHDYWRISTYINDSIQLISDIGNAIYEANNRKITPDLDSMAQKAYQLSGKLDNITNLLIIKNPRLYASKLLKAYVSPDWSSYKKTSGVKTYKNKQAFLKEHFFDNLDFSDSTLLNSEVFYVLCTDYLTKYVDPQTDSNFSKAVDFILKKTTTGSPVYKYILTLLINTFEDTEWERTFMHLVDDFLLKNNTASTGWEQSLAQRSSTIKKLQTGKKAPDFNLTNNRGVSKSLYNIKSKVILLLFWSSKCLHCEEVMPQILEVYKKYKPQGLEIVAVSIETDKNVWINAIAKTNMPWVNVTDFKGMVSPVVESYNAYSTPIFYLLNADKTIIAHPQSSKEIKEILDKALDN